MGSRFFFIEEASTDLFMMPLSSASGIFREGRGVARTYPRTAAGNSQLPGTDWTMMLASLTPDARRASLVPLSRGSIRVMFQRAWTIPMRRAEPSWLCAAPGPLSPPAILDGGVFLFGGAYARGYWVSGRKRWMLIDRPSEYSRRASESGRVIFEVDAK
jgi:hypothetical protein